MLSLTRVLFRRLPTTLQNVRTKGDKFIEFKDEDAAVILDVDEERSKLSEIPMVEAESLVKPKRGVEGVLDIADLVEILSKTGGQDLFTVELPKELNYVRYLVIASASTKRHVLGIGEHIRRSFKERRHPGDYLPRIEGEKSDWVALDLGNIAVHVMTPEARTMYDLESLWSVGPQFDTLSNAENHLVDLLRKHSVNLDDIHAKEG